MELHDSGKQLVSVCSVGKRLTGLGVEVLMHEGMDDKFLNVGKGRGEWHDAARTWDVFTFTLFIPAMA